MAFKKTKTKTKNDYTFRMRMPHKVYLRLRKKCRTLDISASYLVRQLMTSYLLRSDALIAASLRAVEFQKEIPRAEIDSCLNEEPILSDSNRKLLDRLGNDVFLAASKIKIPEDREANHD